MKSAIPALTVLAAATAVIAPAGAQRAPDWTRAAPIRITMTANGYAPARIVLKRGAPYVLTVVNRSDKGHNLTQEAFFRSARVRSGERGWTRKGQIVLAPGESTRVVFQAPMTRSGGRYVFTSTVLGDAGKDYRGVFIIR